MVNEKASENKNLVSLKKLYAFLKKLYPYTRIQWLFSVFSVVTLAYLTSEKLGSLQVGLRSNSGGFSIFFIVYVIVFFFMILLANMKWVSGLVEPTEKSGKIEKCEHNNKKSCKLTKKTVDINRIAKILAISIGSTLLDIALTSLIALIGLLAIGYAYISLSRIVTLLLLGALPASLGLITLSSLTISILQKRINAQNDEMDVLSQQFDNFEKHQKEALSACRKKHEEREKALDELITRILNQQNEGADDKR